MREYRIICRAYRVMPICLPLVCFFGKEMDAIRVGVFCFIPCTFISVCFLLRFLFFVFYFFESFLKVFAAPDASPVPRGPAQEGVTDDLLVLDHRSSAPFFRNVYT